MCGNYKDNTRTLTGKIISFPIEATVKILMKLQTDIIHQDIK